MYLQTLLKEAKRAELEDNAEEAFCFHMQISAYYRKCGNDVMSKIHKDKANVYSEINESKMRFIK